MIELPGARRHGTYSGYVTGCRCDECSAACAEYMRRYRAEHPDYRRREAARLMRIR